MLIVFGSNTLCDDTASPKIAGVIEQLGGQAVVQIEDVYNSGLQVKRSQGNVGGQFVFTASCSYASYDAATTAWLTAYGLLDATDDVVVTPVHTSDVTMTMAGAILRQVQRVQWDGKWLAIRYTFEITSID